MEEKSEDPRVFVSSVVEGFQEFREAARRGIEAAGGEPILVNEDFPASSASPRNACLDAVDSSDVYVAVIGERGGWTAPSGQLVVEEEYEHARSNNIQPIVFLQNVDRDDDAEQLVRKMSDYVKGHFRVEFDTPGELESLVRRTLEPIIESHRSAPLDMATFQHKAEEPYQFSNDASLHFATAPVRQGEVFDPVFLESEEFEDVVYRIGHDRGVQLLSYEKSKRQSIVRDALVIFQKQSDRGREVDDTRLEIQESGHITIDINLSADARKREEDSTGMSGMAISLENVRTLLEPCFLFSANLYDGRDKYGRYHELVYNVTLVVGNRAVVEKSVANRNSVQIPMRRSPNEAIAAFDEPRIISRPDLRDASDEIERVITLLRRKYSQDTY